LPRSLPAPLREEKTHSTTRGAFPRWGTRTRTRTSWSIPWRGHVCFRDDPTPRRPFVCKSPNFAFAPPEYCPLDPRPRPLATPRFLRGASTDASLDQAAAQRLLQLYFRRTDTLSSIRISHVRSLPRYAEDADRRAHFRATVRWLDLPLSKEDDERSKPRQSFRSRLRGAASTPRNETSKTTAQPGRRLRATLRSDHRLPRWPLNDSAELRGPSRPEQRTSRPPPAAARRRAQRSPSSVELLEHPWCHRFVERWTGCPHRPLEPAKANAVTPSREGKAHVRKPRCLPPSGITTGRRSLFSPGDRQPSITPPRPHSRQWHCKAEVPAPLFPQPRACPWTRQARDDGSTGRGQVMFLDSTERPQRP